MICKQLNFASASKFECCSSHGQVSTNFSYDNVKCNGTEATLDACSHVNVSDCRPRESVWLVCNQFAG